MDEPGLTLVASFLGLSKRRRTMAEPMFALRLMGMQLIWSFLEVSLSSEEKMRRVLKTNYYVLTLPSPACLLFVQKNGDESAVGIIGITWSTQQAVGVFVRSFVKYDVSVGDGSRRISWSVKKRRRRLGTSLLQTCQVERYFLAGKCTWLVLLTTES